MIRALRGALVAAALAALAGCAALTPPQTRALQQARPAALQQPVELGATPFFPQAEYECGPAALATALGAAGISVKPEDLTEQVYLPARHGSLQLEMLATARRQGALAVRLPPTLEAVFGEVSAGHPVLVLQNLSLPIAPAWHYAVVIGHDLARGEVLLRSGTTERQVMTVATFEHTWARSGYWAFVALAPGQLPATATESEVVAAAVALERVASPPVAQRVYDAALARWPDSLTLAIGAGNARHAAGDLNGAARAFGMAAEQHDSAPAWINLAEVRLAQGRVNEASNAVRRALARVAGDEPRWQAAALATQARIQAAQDSARARASNKTVPRKGAQRKDSQGAR